MNAVTQQQDTSILFPVGRIVQGDLYEPQTEDMQGNPLTVKSGNNQGQRRVNYFFSLAIPKTRPAWWEEGQGTAQPWGPKILQLTQGWWPQGQWQTPRFSWKITDGDDTTPNPEANMRRNCDREGYPGHWVVRLGSGFPTKIFDEHGTPLVQPGLVKRGYWVEVLASIASNENAQKPGIYINHQMVAYRAPGKEILSGPDPRSVGFGRSALPPGVTAQPIGNAANMPATLASNGHPPAANGAPMMPGAASMPAMPGPNMAVPGSTPMTPGAAPAMPGPAMPGATPVQPQAAFLHPPGNGAAPPPPAAPAVPTSPPPPAFVCPLGAPTGYKMTNLNGPRYEAFRAGNWTDPQMINAGHMVRL